MFQNTIGRIAVFAVTLSSMLVVAAPDPAAAQGINACGPFINSTLRMSSVATTTSSTVFVDLASAVTNFTVPAGQTRCVKVLFTGEAACRGPAAVNDFCFIRATDNGVEMSPQGGGAQVFLSEDATENAHAYQWAQRVRAGNHRIVIQRRVGNASTSFLLDDWTFDVMLLN